MEPTEQEPTPAEQAALFREWRDDAAQRPLMEKAVDYSDAPYREPAADSYAAQRQAASARAGHRPPGHDVPRL